MTEAWPEGTLHRFRTDGGATVDVEQDPDDSQVTATCRGCGDDRTSHKSDHEGSSDSDRHIKVVRSWAQSHAEWCREMPRP